MSVETSAERLARIKRADISFRLGGTILESDWGWLIERAEENVRLQKQLAAAKPVFSRRMLESEVKIMRKALTKISATPITRGISPVDRALQSVVLEARQALGDVNHNSSAYHPISHTTNIEEEME